MAAFEMGETVQPARIKVVGVGGCGQNAVDTMIDANLENVEFLSVNTDVQALSASKALTRVQVGAKLTKGLGTGGDPQIGKNAALEDKQRLHEALEGADMIFVTAGLGGGTGTGASPVVAQIARETGALTVGVVTKPFIFEGKWRMTQAEDGLRELKAVVDTVITIPNQRLMAIADKNTTLTDAFRMVDEILLQAVKGISDIVTRMGRQNRDFADVKTIMSMTGMALMGSGVASGENRAIEAAHRAISSPLLEDVSITGARGVLYNISGSANLTLFEVNEVGTLIREAAHEDAKIIFGRVMDETMGEKIRVTVIATGFGRLSAEAKPQPAAPSVQPRPTRVAPVQPVYARPRPVAPANAEPWEGDVRVLRHPGGLHPAAGPKEAVRDREPRAASGRRSGTDEGDAREQDSSDRGGRSSGVRSFFKWPHLGGGAASSRNPREQTMRASGQENDPRSGPKVFSDEELDALRASGPDEYDVPAFIRRRGGANGNGESEDDE